MGTRPVGSVRRFWVYVLRCSDGSFYTGSTTDVERRVLQHSSGRGSKYTRSRLPAKLAYLEEAGSLSRALRRESEIKKLSRSSKLLLCSSYSAMLQHSVR